jgi:hypothetical protein
VTQTGNSYHVRQMFKRQVVFPFTIVAVLELTCVCLLYMGTHVEGWRQLAPTECRSTGEASLARPETILKKRE